MTIVTANYFSKALNRQVTYRAIIPETQKKQSVQFEDKPYLYPTLYLLHGYTGDQNDWMDYSIIRELAEQHEIAVIMPAGENSFYFDPPIGPQFSTLVGKELVEKTRALFPLSEKREDTLLAGVSMGGYGALLNGILYAETFSFIGSLSGVVLSASSEINEGSVKIPIPILQSVVKSGEWEDLPPELDLLELLDKEKYTKNLPQLFLFTGTEDYLYREISYLHRYMQKKNIQHEYFEAPGEHDWLFWNQAIQIFIDGYEKNKF